MKQTSKTLIINEKHFIKTEMFNDGVIFNGPKISVHSSHGCFQQRLNNNCFMINEEESIYIHGKHVVKMDIKSKETEYLMFDNYDTDSTAFCWNQSTKAKGLQVAIAFKGQKDAHPYIKMRAENGKLYELLHDFLGYNNQIIDMCFMGNRGKYILSVGNNLNGKHHLAVFSVGSGRSKLVGQQEYEKKALGCLHSEEALDKFLIWGPRSIAEYNFNEKESYFDSIPYQLDFLNEHEYIVGAAMQQKTTHLAIVTSKNNLYYLKYREKEDMILMNPLEHVQRANKFSGKKEVQTHCIPTCISPVASGGFVIGFAGINCIMMYDIVKETKIIEKAFHSLDFHNVFKTLNIHCSPDESHLILAVQHSNRSIHQMLEEDLRKEQVLQTMSKEQKLLLIEEKESESDLENDENQKIAKAQLKTTAKQKLDKVKKMVKTAITMGGIKQNFDEVPQSALGRIEIYVRYQQQPIFLFFHFQGIFINLVV